MDASMSCRSKRHNRPARKIENENAGIKEVAHIILKILSTLYPDYLDSLLIRRELANFGHPVDSREIMFYLMFLQECGYVVIEERPPDTKLARITVKGWEKLGVTI